MLFSRLYGLISENSRIDSKWEEKPIENRYDIEPQNKQEDEGCLPCADAGAGRCRKPLGR
jgi:hypothetical protein